jgi:CxxC motif-containing protein (DUF1111 family)
MKRYIISVAICLGTAHAQADDSAMTAGNKLHEENCLSCHKPDIYTRDRRRVTSKQKLTSQVNLCVQQLQLTWFDEEKETVEEYLNKEYYHFK